MTDFQTRLAGVKREIRSRSFDGIERRTIATTVEARDAGEGAPWQIVGYGLVYNSWSDDLGGFKERIAPGAADEVLANNPDIRGLINHNPDLILGRTHAGNMRVASDTNGVRYEIDAPDTSYANDLQVSLKRGDINQSSFAFRLSSGGAEWTEDAESGLLLRTITKFSGLFDMSPVTYPAYGATSSGAHSFSPVDDERTDDGPSAGERDGDGDVTDTQADEGTWRLNAVKRRIALRETA